MNARRWRCALLLAPWLLAAAPAQALRSDREQPIRVSSDAVDVNQKTGVSKYAGNVVLVQGTLRIEASEVLVYFRNNEVDKVFAKGKPVRYRQRIDGQPQEVEASALRLEYYAAKHRVDLYDQVAFRQGSDVFQSPVVRYDLVTTQMTAEGRNSPQRVHSIITPRSKPKTGDANGAPAATPNKDQDAP